MGETGKLLQIIVQYRFPAEKQTRKIKGRERRRDQVGNKHIFYPVVAYADTLFKKFPGQPKSLATTTVSQSDLLEKT